MIEADTTVEALSRTNQGSFAGIFVLSDRAEEQFRVGSMLHHERILEGMPDGVVLLDEQGVILWANDCVARWHENEAVVGIGFYDLFRGGGPANGGICPFAAAKRSRQSRCTTIRCDDNRYFQVHAVPVREQQGDEAKATLIVTIRDVTSETLQQQKAGSDSQGRHRTLRPHHRGGLQHGSRRPDRSAQV